MTFFCEHHVASDGHLTIIIRNTSPHEALLGFVGQTRDHFRLRQLLIEEARTLRRLINLRIAGMRTMRRKQPPTAEEIGQAIKDLELGEFMVLEPCLLKKI